MSSDDLIKTVAGKLAEVGGMTMANDPDLTKEALLCVKALLDERPAEVTNSPDCDEITMLTGVSLGIGLERSGRDIEAAGGFEELTGMLAEGNIQGIIEKARAAGIGNTE